MAESVTKRPQTGLQTSIVNRGMQAVNSGIDSLGRAITSPLTDFPSRIAKRVSDTISPPNHVGSPLRGFFSGATEAIGNQLTDMTSPAALASSAVMGGLGGALFKAGKGIKTAADTGRKIKHFSNAHRLPAEFAGVGEEAVYNAPRTINAVKEGINVEKVAEANRRGLFQNMGQAPKANDLGEKMTNLRKVREEAAIREGRKELGRGPTK